MDAQDLSREAINLRHVELNLDLRETWSEFWECLKYESKEPIYLPFYHLRPDGFWDIEFDEEITSHQPKSLRRLIEMMGKVSLDEDLITLIDEDEFRDQLINALLNGG